jgi:cytosine/adenosine deaminase-related metal-dependent hydrolase
VQRRVGPYLDLQLVAFPQDGFYRAATAERNLLRALDRGVQVVGGIPHFERTMADGAASVRRLCEIAADAACSSTCTATNPTIRCRGTSKRLQPKRTGSDCTAALPART